MIIDDWPLPDGMSAPARRTLSAIGVSQLHHLTRFCELEIRLLHGMGPKAIARLRAAMVQSGWSFAEERNRPRPGRRHQALTGDVNTSR